MLVKEVMSPRSQVINADATLREAAVKLRDCSNGVLPVAGTNGALIGMLSEQDLNPQGFAADRGPGDRVSDLILDEAYFCFEDDDIEEAIVLMQEHKVRHLIVLNDNQRMSLVGTLGVGEIANGAGAEGSAEAIAACDDL